MEIGDHMDSRFNRNRSGNLHTKDRKVLQTTLEQSIPTHLKLVLNRLHD